MGCGQVNKPEQSVWINAFSGMFRYRVKVLLGESTQVQEFVHEDQFDEMPVTTLMNILAFTGKEAAQFDANFLSTYDKETDQFEYSMQRIVGLDVEKSNGKEWMLYVNKIKFTWNQICQQNIRVKPKDSMIWILQNPSDIKM